jgi:tetratricopeptide (TPR) repeat protein
MSGSHHFICYSTKDINFAIRLYDELTAGPPPLKVWLDKRRLHAGFDWDSQLVEALRQAETVLFLMSPDSVDDLSPCKDEWTRALAYKKPIVPLLLDSQCEIPFGLGRRQYIDFTGDFETGMAKLRLHLDWLLSPDGQLQLLRYRLQDASRDLRRASSELECRRIESEVTQLKAEAQRWEEIIASPENTERRVDESIQRGLERERERPNRPKERIQRIRFVNAPPAVAPGYFQDRFVETQVLVEFLKDRAVRIMTVVGRGGVGKTAVVCRLLEALQAGHLPDSQELMEVDGIAYQSAAGSRRINFATIFEDLSQMLLPETLPALDAIYKSQHSTAEKMGALLDRFPSGCHVLLLDNFENLLDPTTGRILDPELDAALSALVTYQPHGVKVVITTRIRPADLLLIGPGRQSVLTLDEGLDSPFAEKVLREMDRATAVGLKEAPETKLRELRDRVRGYPRALEAIYAILAADRTATVDDLVAKTARLPDNVVEALVGEAFNRLDSAAEQVMKALSIYENPVRPIAVDYLLQPYTSGIDSAPVLRRLANMHFVRKESDRYYLHPVDRNYAQSQIPVGTEEDRSQWPPPFSQFALRDRAADFYCETRKPRREWTSIQDLAAQLAEFDLRFAGGDYETALAILWDLCDDYLIQWGHYSLCIEMAERLHGLLGDRREELKRIQILASAHQFGGGLRQALTLWEQAQMLAKELGSESDELRATGNLAGCRGQLGEYHAVISTFRRVLNFARKHSHSSWEETCHSRIGNAFQELGKTRFAINHLAKALRIARDMRDAHGEEGEWHNLGNCYFRFGEIGKARQHYEEALRFSSKTGDRSWEANHLSALGSCRAIVGDTLGAERYYQAALQLRRDIGHRTNEASSLAALANCAARRGDSKLALETQRDALAIAQEFQSDVDTRGFREGLADLLLDIGECEAAIREVQFAIDLGKQFHIPLASANCCLALIKLISGDIDAAQNAADEALKYDVPLENSGSAAIRGLVAVRRDNMEAARKDFVTALAKADELLARTPELFGQLDVKALALCGLGLCESSRHVAAATATYRMARTINRDPGVIARVLRLFDQLAIADKNQLLMAARSAAAGT